MSGLPRKMVSSEPQIAYTTATPKSSGLMLHKTPENDTAVRVPFRISRVNESVVVVNARTSSVMRWSGFATPVAESSR